MTEYEIENKAIEFACTNCISRSDCYNIYSKLPNPNECSRIQACKSSIEWMQEEKDKEIEQLKQKVYAEFENFLRIILDHQQHGNILREEDFKSFIEDFKQAIEGE